MSIWIKAILSGAIIASFVFFLYDKIAASREPGLYDMHCIVEASLETQPGDIKSKKDILGETPAIIKQRITDLGYNSIVRSYSNNRMDIRIEGVKDTLLVRQTITRSSKIEFREIYTLNELPSLFATADRVTRNLLHNEDLSIYTFMSPLISSEKEGHVEYPAAIAAVNKKDTAVLSRILHHFIVVNVLPADLNFCYGILTDDNIIQNIPDDLYLYAIRTRGEKARLRNNDIEDAMVKNDFEFERPEILFLFTNKGKAKWASMTRENIGRYLVIILDETVIAAPRIYRTNEAGRARLQTRFSTEEAGKLANQLKTGMLAADLVIIQREVSGGTATAMLSKIIAAAIVFIIISCLAFFTFKTLKNR